MRQHEEISDTHPESFTVANAQPTLTIGHQMEVRKLATTDVHAPRRVEMCLEVHRAAQFEHPEHLRHHIHRANLPRTARS